MPRCLNVVSRLYIQRKVIFLYLFRNRSRGTMQTESHQITCTLNLDWGAYSEGHWIIVVPLALHSVFQPSALSGRAAMLIVCGWLLPSSAAFRPSVLGLGTWALVHLATSCLWSSSGRKQPSVLCPGTLLSPVISYQQGHALLSIYGLAGHAIYILLRTFQLCHQEFAAEW